MANRFIIAAVYLISFGLAFFALSGIKYEKFCYVSNPNKVRVLLILLAMGLAYVTAEFILGITLYI